jgi:serine/threonine protein kinase
MLHAGLCFPCCSFKAGGGPTLSEALDVLQQVIAALMHLHSPPVNILHGDIRAANVLIDSQDPLKARVADFGVSRRLRVPQDASCGNGGRAGHGEGGAGGVPLQVGCSCHGVHQPTAPYLPPATCHLPPSTCHLPPDTL